MAKKKSKVDEPYRAVALWFLKDIRKRADFHANRLDPQHVRDYATDPLLKALDGIVSKATAALDAVDPDWRDKDEGSP